MKLVKLLKISRQYGVRGIHFGGCIESQAKGFQGAMRRKAHAHCHPADKWCGWICFLTKNPDKRALRNSKPTQLFWHEVGHIYRRSWTQKQCNKWAWHQVKL